MNKVVPSDRMRRELDEVLAGVGEQEDAVEGSTGPCGYVRGSHAEVRGDVLAE